LSHTVGNLVVHLIFSTKKRQPFITPEIRADLFAYMGGIVRELGGAAIIINGTIDHLHMLVRIRPVHAVAQVTRVVKANSSRWARQRWKTSFAWQTGYGSFTVSESNVAAVSRYIATQEEHHRKQSFEEEFVAFLKKNKIAYDERYIWD
jgi:REP element-mobilizing transposase RayT